MDEITKGVSRRAFIGAAGAVGAAGALGPLSGAAAAQGDRAHGRGSIGSMPQERIGIQLFRVRDLLADNELDLPATFEMLSDAGYALVEVGGTYDGRTAAQFRELAESYGLKPEGSHVPRSADAWRTDRATIWTDAAALGLSYVGLASPPAGSRSRAGFQALAQEFNQWGAEARERGLNFYFHNHPDDFLLEDGVPIYNTLLEETDPELVFFELDIAWIEAGGQSAYEYLRTYGPARFPLFHVKDLTWSDPWPATPPQAQGPRQTPAGVNQGGRAYWLRDVGKGDIDFAKVFSALKDPRDHVYHVEHDDAGTDETLDSAASRPRNPAGSANTAWTIRKHLAELEISRRRSW